MNPGGPKRASNARAVHKNDQLLCHMYPSRPSTTQLPTVCGLGVDEIKG
jgi:hypothetical protein